MGRGTCRVSSSAFRWRLRRLRFAIRHPFLVGRSELQLRAHHTKSFLHRDRRNVGTKISHFRSHHMLVPLTTMRSICPHYHECLAALSSVIFDEEGTVSAPEMNRSAKGPLILSGDADAEVFAHTFIEPQLSHASEAATEVSWLNYKATFRNLRAHLPFEWLTRFPFMPHEARHAVQSRRGHGGRVALNALISSRCQVQSEPHTGAEGRHSPAAFWLPRGILFPRRSTRTALGCRSERVAQITIGSRASRTLEPSSFRTFQTTRHGFVTREPTHFPCFIRGGTPLDENVVS